MPKKTTARAPKTAPKSGPRKAKRAGKKTTKPVPPKATPVKVSAKRSEPPRAKPFVKWAGGKRKLLKKIISHIPGNYDFGTYHEPFLGGGAVFFGLPPVKRAFLSDSNERLVRCYRGIKTDVEDVISLLKSYERSRSFFLELRKRDIDAVKSDAEVAAWFIFLNKLGFNGLYRVNSKNRFNVPFGDNRNPRVCDEQNLKACAEALEEATITHQDFSEALKVVEPGHLVYLDPPYVPLSATSYFTSYTAKGFGHEDQVKLRNAARTLKESGAYVLISNSSAAASLYKDGFDSVEVLASRPLNSKGDRRGKIAELLIT